MDKNLIQRTLSGIVYVAVIILCTTPLGAHLINSISPGLVKQEYLYYGLITFLMSVGSWECFKIMKFGKGYERFVVFPLVIFIFFVFSKRYFHFDFFFDFRISEILALVLIIIAVVTLFKYPNELYFDSGKLIFTVIYVALPFSFALGLPKFLQL
ncbi:CDP-diglyceride synthetase [Chryseobacterium ginsenosidimutans]|nr:CDP-diglyceride synthetase [Chryseobacterium ginsenosidimutans]